MDRPTTFIGACLDGLGFGCQLAVAAAFGWYGANGVAWAAGHLIGVSFHYLPMP